MSPTSEQILFQSTKDPLTLMQLDHQENSSLVAKGENRAGGPSNVEIVTFNSKRLQDELHAVGVEIKQHEDKIQFLNAQRKKRGESILNLQAILSKYKSSAAHRTESEDNSNIQNEDITSEQILQHESSAAGLFYLIKNQHGTRASQLMSTKDVLGTVAELGKVDDENLSSLLSEYLGTRTMLAFVCKTYDGVKTLELYDKEGNVTRNDGLHGLCSSIGRTIKGRFDVIYLEDLRPYSGQFVADDPQRRLDLLKPKLPGGDCPHGFLGFAVNMIDVEPKNLLCVTAYGCGLRETLFYSLFSHLQVYKTRADMINALPCISRGAISLDGGMIRTAGVFSLGSRDEVNVRFAKPSATSCVTDYFTETNKHMEELTRKQEKLEEDIKREQVLLDHAKFNFGKKKEEFLRSMAQSSSYNIQNKKSIRAGGFSRSLQSKMSSHVRVSSRNLERDANIRWTDKTGRVFLELLVKQKEMGNWKNGKLTDSGRKNVIEEFYQATGSHYKWDKFKNRIDTLRRSFHAYKRLAKNVRDVDFNPQTGGIEADELWWTERAKECKNIGKVRALCSIPLLEIIFDRRHVTAGNKCFGTVNLSVDQTALEGSGESEEFTNEAMRVQREPARTDSGKRSRSVTSLHKGKKTCKEEELVDHLSSSLEHQNMKSEESPEDRAQRYPYDIEVVYQKFISMDAVIDGSRFYWEGQKWLMEAETHRRWFMVQPDDAHRIELVERMTGVKCQALD